MMIMMIVIMMSRIYKYKAEQRLNNSMYLLEGEGEEVCFQFGEVTPVIVRLDSKKSLTGADKSLTEPSKEEEVG
jgi:hypothetical protein